MISTEKTSVRLLFGMGEGDREELEKGLPQEACPLADTSCFFDPKSEVYSIDEKETGEKAGYLSLIFDEKNRSARLDVFIFPAMRCKGLASDAAEAVIKSLFKEKGINRVYASHAVRNPAAGTVLRKIGMSYEGMSRESFYNASGYHDTHNYAVLKKDVL